MTHHSTPRRMCSTHVTIFAIRVLTEDPCTATLHHARPQDSPGDELLHRYVDFR